MQIRESQGHIRKLEHELKNVSFLGCYVCRQRKTERRDQVTQVNIQVERKPEPCKEFGGVSVKIMYIHSKYDKTMIFNLQDYAEVLNKLQREKDHLRGICSERKRQIIHMEKLLQQYQPVEQMSIEEVCID